MAVSAAVSGGALPQRRRKQATYGKQLRRSTEGSGKDFPQFGAAHSANEPPSAMPTFNDERMVPQRPNSLPKHGEKAYLTSNPPLRPRDDQQYRSVPPIETSAADQIKPLHGNASIFDVPSSEEEDSWRAPDPFQSRPSIRLSSIALNRSIKARSSKADAYYLSHAGQLPPLGRPTKRPRLSESLVTKQSPQSSLVGNIVTSPVPVQTEPVTHQSSRSPQKPSDERRSIQKINSRDGVQRVTAKDFSNKALPKTQPVANETMNMNKQRGADNLGTSVNQSPSNRTKREKTSIRARNPSTPPAAAASEQKQVSTTPKQAGLWSTLLTEQESPSRFPNASAPLPRRLLSPQKTTVPRLRLIDTLIEAEDRSAIRDGVTGGDDLSQQRSRAVTTSKASLDSQWDSATGSQQGVHARTQTKITYAGQRSYLDESQFGLEDLLAHPLSAETVAPPGRTLKDALVPSQRRANASLVYATDDDDADDGVRGMRSIHELRAAADSIRFENDLLLDDIERTGKESLSRKRNALLEICSKLVDASFQERFMQSGMELRIMAACCGETDPLIGSAVAGVLICVLRGPSTTQMAVQLGQMGALGFFSSFLMFDKDVSAIAKDRRSNMSKIAQISLLNFRQVMSSLNVLDNVAPTPISPRLLGLKAWELLVRRIRKDGDLSCLLNRTQLLELLRILESTLRTTRSEDPKLGFVEVRTIISLFEAFTIAEACSLDDTMWDVQALADLVDCLDMVVANSDFDDNTTFELVLRICLNLANNHQGNCEAFCKASFVRKILASIIDSFVHETNRASDGSAVWRLDKLLLALGAMLNLAEWSDAARLAVLQDKEGLDALVRIFLDSRVKVAEADSLAASSTNVAHGYLAMFLGNLCRNELVRQYICARLPEGALRILVDAVNEFLSHHKEADKVSEGNESWAAFTDRLAAVGKMLHGLVQ